MTRPAVGRCWSNAEQGLVVPLSAAEQTRCPCADGKYTIRSSIPLGYRNAWVTHEPRCSRIGPSLKFAIIAAPNRSTKNVNSTKSRQFHDMLPSLFPHIIRIDVTSSGVLVTICGVLHHCLPRPLACLLVHMTVSEPQALEGDRPR
jgi:hypothetical protein